MTKTGPVLVQYSDEYASARGINNQTVNDFLNSGFQNTNRRAPKYFQNTPKILNIMKKERFHEMLTIPHQEIGNKQ